MKKTLLVLSLSASLFACKNKPGNDLSTDKTMVLTDTSLLKRSGLLSDTGLRAPAAAGKVGTTTSSTTTTVTTTTTSSAAVKETKTNHAVTNKPAGAAPAAATTATTATAAPVKKDRAISDAAIGTAIGAGSGAVIGAVVSKDKVKGAVIGGVLGGAGGYAVGRSRDVKSGRVARKKASTN